MGWETREPTANLLVLGDEQGNVPKVGGLLLSVKQDAKYPGRLIYQVVAKDGTVHNLAGSVSLGNQLGPGDVGKFFRAEFKGWGRSANGQFKEIRVQVWNGDVPPEMQRYPKYQEAQANAQAQHTVTARAPQGGFPDDAMAEQVRQSRPATGPTPPKKPAPTFDDFPAALEAPEEDDLPF